MLHRNVTLAVAAIISTVSAAHAQAPASELGPKVGEMAPDFTLGGATKDGVLTSPITLSKLRGQTVVIAFNGGKGVTVIGISTDADTTQANWARESNFPMTFASDFKGEVGKAYGAYLEKPNMDNRLLFVVGPDGKISYTAKPFKAMVADAYPELGAAVKKASGAK
jgi:peroxiredoxin